MDWKKLAIYAAVFLAGVAAADKVRALPGGSKIPSL